MSTSPRVLIVDQLAETREVLRTLLTRRGATTIEARRPASAAKLATLHHVDLIVLDADSDPSTVGSETAKLEAAASRQGTPLVILGTVPRVGRVPSANHFVAKPYHYEPLIRKIDCLLAAA